MYLQEIKLYFRLSSENLPSSCVLPYFFFFFYINANIYVDTAWRIRYSNWSMTSCRYFSPIKCRQRCVYDSRISYRGVYGQVSVLSVYLGASSTFYPSLQTQDRDPESGLDRRPAPAVFPLYWSTHTACSQHTFWLSSGVSNHTQTTLRLLTDASGVVVIARVSVLFLSLRF